MSRQMARARRAVPPGTGSLQRDGWMASLCIYFRSVVLGITALQPYVYLEHTVQNTFKL
jgi:hypothetical protein